MKTVKFLLMALVATAFVGCDDSDDSTSKIQLDTPAPTVDESTITTTSATVTWSAISNAASYEVQLDGATVQTVTSPSVSLSSLLHGRRTRHPGRHGGLRGFEGRHLLVHDLGRER